jgi:biopolymer transport protein ExbD
MKLPSASASLDPAKMRLPLIALIDVILFLLMYFLYAGSLAAEEAQLAASLATQGSRGGAGAFDLGPQILDVERGADETVFRIDQLRFENRQALIEALRTFPPETRIAIRAADQASVAGVAAAVQACHDAGLLRIAYMSGR